MVAEVEVTVGDDGIGPGLFHGVGAGGRVGRGEAAAFAVAFRVCLDEGDVAVFAVEVESVFGQADGGRADGAVFPADVAGGELDAEQGLGGGAVEEGTGFDGAADGGGEFGFEVEFLRGDGSVLGGEAHGASAGAG